MDVDLSLFLKEDLDLVNRFNLKCPICLNLLEDPTETKCGHEDPTETKCGHLFCRDCIKKSLASSIFCPICKAYISGSNHDTALHRSPAILRIIKGLRMVCR